MKILVDFCMVSIGVDVSISKYVAACAQVLRDAGLETEIHAFGTNVEGEWQQVFDAIQRCHELVHDMGCPRLLTTVKISSRTDREQTIKEKVYSVTSKLKEKAEHNEDYRDDRLTS